MSDLPELRASDADRERVALQLREHAVQGRLTLEEFSERMEKAYLAKTMGDLAELGSDLPAEPASLPARRATRFTGVVFGDVERTGRWRVGRPSFALVAFGNLDLDARHAELGGRDASITAFVLCGNIDVYVPQGVEVDIGGLSVFGHRRDWGEDPPRTPDPPLLRVRVFTLFGTADLWRVPAELARAGFREVIGTLRARGRELPPG